jgi:hypothetical protein
MQDVANILCFECVHPPQGRRFERLQCSLHDPAELASRAFARSLSLILPWLASSLLPLRYCSLSPEPLCNLYHSRSGTLTRAWPSSSRCRRFSRVAPFGALLVRKCQEPSNSTAHTPALLLLSPPITRPLSCTHKESDGDHVDGISRLWAANLVFHRQPQRLAHLLLGR